MTTMKWMPPSQRTTAVVVPHSIYLATEPIRAKNARNPPLGRFSLKVLLWFSKQVNIKQYDTTHVPGPGKCGVRSYEQDRNQANSLRLLL